MRRWVAFALLASLPALAAPQASFRVGARVIRSAQIVVNGLSISATGSPQVDVEGRPGNVVVVVNY